MQEYFDTIRDALADLAYNGDTAEFVAEYDEIVKNLRYDILETAALKRIKADENAVEMVQLLVAPDIDDDALRTFLYSCTAYTDDNLEFFGSLAATLALVGVARTTIERLEMDGIDTDEEPLYKYLVANLD